MGNLARMPRLSQPRSVRIDPMQFKIICLCFEILRKKSVFFPLLGVYEAAHNLQIEWVVVKGISDYADGTKDLTKAWQPFASMMAASLVANVLSQPSVFKDWPHYDGGGK